MNHPVAENRAQTIMVDQNKLPDLRLEFFSRPIFLGVVRRMLDSLFVRVGIRPEKAAQLCLAVDEAIANIIRHGYDNAPDGRIELLVTLQTEPTRELILELLDQAKCVDLDTIQSRDLDDIRPGGLGVHIISEIMDKAEYSHRPEGGMRLVMRYPLPEQPSWSTKQDGDQSPMTVEVVKEDGHSIIRPDGDIDLASSPMLRAKLKDSLENASGRVIVDLTKVPYMDSSGVATLVGLLQSCRRDNLELILCQLNERVMSVFQIARLDGVFTIKGSLEEATGA